MTCYLWVGISFKRSKNGVTMAPLDARSASGSIVNEIATHFPGKSHVFDNVINYVPELEDGTTRPVMISDFDKSWEAFWLRVERVNPERLIIFGGQTLKYARKAERIKCLDKYQLRLVRGIETMFCDHPSYYNVYKKTLVGDYIRKVVSHL